jgi:Leucine-rich repeat (LRR) protein
MLTGPVSFICRTAYKSLASLDLSNNILSGELPDCWANAADYLSFLNLANNNLFGEIPTSIGFLHRLQILQLRSNNFVGKVPSLINNTELIVPDLSENKLSGYVPTWIGSLTSLIVLSLRKNEFLGSVPLQICQMTNAQVLDLSHNRLIGSIPNCINNLTSLLKTVNNLAAVSSVVLRDISYTDESNYMKFEVKAFVQWKGQDSEYQNTLGLLKLIDLSTNRISGKIPEEFTDLQGLISLNLSSNSLIGNISPKIGQMKMLEILDLSKNQLSGEIPTNLASLTFLSVLDLSNNNLTGRIPSSTQLQSFNASVYTGNEQLCGLPLLKCGGVVNSPPPTVVYGKDESNLFPLYKRERKSSLFVPRGLLWCLTCVLFIPCFNWMRTISSLYRSPSLSAASYKEFDRLSFQFSVR